jgi:IS5 family transposase
MNTAHTYRIRNWSEYNKALIKRGSVTVWFEDAVPVWKETHRSGKKGRPQTYSDEAILCALVIRSVYHLPLRALQGFLIWMFSMMTLSLPVPCYTRICRRAASLGRELKKLSTKRPTDIIFDSTGVKVYGEGEWKVRQHGKGKRRVWRKVHLGICPHSHEIILSQLTDSAEPDARAAERMLGKLPKRVKRVYGDGAYDQGPFRRKAHRRGIHTIIPPRRGSKLQDIEAKPWMKSRNDAVLAMKGLGDDDEARALWKMLSGYHKRSLVETTMSRFKGIFGPGFRSREWGRQQAELYAKSVALNKMTRLGMPKGRWVTG